MVVPKHDYHPPPCFRRFSRASEGSMRVCAAELVAIRSLNLMAELAIERWLNLRRTSMKRRILIIAGVALCLSLLTVYSGHTATADARFEISYPAGLDHGPITGRVFVMLSKNNRLEPRLQAG